MASPKTNPRFEKFWTAITDQLSGLKPSAKKVFWTSLQEVYGERLSSVNKRSKSGDKPVSGWNGFMAEKMKDVKKDESIEPTERLGVIAEMWNKLGDDGKAEWCEEHGYPAPKSPSKKKKTPSKKKTDASDTDEKSTRKRKIASVDDSEPDEKPKRKSPVQKITSANDSEPEEKPKRKTPVKGTETSDQLGKPKHKTPVKKVSEEDETSEQVEKPKHKTPVKTATDDEPAEKPKKAPTPKGSDIELPVAAAGNLGSDAS